METEEYKAKALAEMFVSNLEKVDGKKYLGRIRRKMIQIYMAGYLHA